MSNSEVQVKGQGHFRCQDQGRSSSGDETCLTEYVVLELRSMGYHGVKEDGWSTMLNAEPVGIGTWL